MNWLLVATIICIAFLFWLFRTDANVGDFVIGVVLVATVCILGLWLAVGINQWDFAPRMASMAQVRASVAALGCTASEDVIGTATNLNRDIQADRLWNTRWLADPFVPDGVDTVTFIAIPICR